jgi:hypothetical protein
MRELLGYSGRGQTHAAQVRGLLVQLTVWKTKKDKAFQSQIK